MRRLLVLITVSLLTWEVLQLGVPSQAAEDRPVPTCQGRPATMVGTARGDFLTGTPGDDVIVGGRGGDQVDGRGGDDLICGGLGADRIEGGRGDDRLHGGRDRASGPPESRFLQGDLIDGGPGDDLLDVGRDTRLHQGPPDTVTFEHAARGVVVDLVRGTARGQGRDLLVVPGDIGVVATPYDDRVTGSPGDDHVTGLAGDDVIHTGDGADRAFADAAYAGRPGDDVITLGRGRDSALSFAGRDRVDAGPGDDYVGAYADVPAVVDAGRGDDRVQQDVMAEDGMVSVGGPGTDIVTLRAVDVQGGEGAELAVDAAAGTSRLDLGATDPTQPPATGTVSGFEEHQFVGYLAWAFTGTPGPDRVWAVTGGPLTASTFAGDDWIIGSEGDDVLHAGDGTDELWGDLGDDTCSDFEVGEC